MEVNNSLHPEAGLSGRHSGMMGGGQVPRQAESTGMAGEVVAAALGNWEGKGIRSRRRSGASTPTDSNATVEDLGCAQSKKVKKTKKRRKDYAISFATADRSDIGPLKAYMGLTQSEVVFAQETHCAKEQVATMRSQARNAGWKMISSLVVPTGGRAQVGGSRLL